MNIPSRSPRDAKTPHSSTKTAGADGSGVMSDFVTVAILAKDAAHVLPLHLECIDNLDYPKDRLNLYVRTNNNKDATPSILEDWLRKVGDSYADVHFDASDLDVPVGQHDPHEWTPARVAVLADIRQASIEWAYERNSHYFVSDCDNFLAPDALSAPMSTGLPMVAPLLTCHIAYSNYHEAVNEWGYLEQTPLYLQLLRRQVRGLIEVPVVHCTYFVRNEELPKLSYCDDSGRHEYVVFSESARKHGVLQYLDNRRVYGHITFATNSAELEADPLYSEFTTLHALGTSR